MTDEDHNLDGDLFARLSEIDERMLEICESGHAGDPDAIMDQLASEATFVRECVDGLMNDLEGHPERFTNLNQIVDLASREFLMSTPQPVVVKTTTHPGLPDLEYADEAVLAAIIRALQIGADHAGPGCEIRINTRLDDGRAMVEIETAGIDPNAEPSLPVKLRSISLTDLVHSLHAEFAITQKRDALIMSLGFGIDAKTH